MIREETQCIRDLCAAPRRLSLIHISRIREIRQVGSDRIVEICTDATNELGFQVKHRLIIEIMGRHSNILLVDICLLYTSPEYLIAIGIPAASVEYLALPALSHDDIKMCIRDRYITCFFYYGKNL